MVFGDDPQDPLGLGRYVPDVLAIWQSSNLYVYCLNNPIMWVDPSGEFVDLLALQLKQLASKYGPKALDAVKRGGSWVVGRFSSGSSAAQGAAQAARQGAAAVPRIANIAQNTQHHIMQSKHLWNRVVSDSNNWQQINRVINRVMADGTHRPHGTTEGVFKATMRMGNETVTVTYRIREGSKRISNAWVNRR